MPVQKRAFMAYLKSMKASIYTRVSKDDGSQDPVNQLAQLRDYCARQGWTIEVEYIDRATGKSANRDCFRELFEAASRRQFDVVIVWALDRFTREGVLETFQHIERLRQYGVQFESYTEPHFRTTGAAGELIMAVSAWIAKQERLRISERTKAGLDTARKKGKVVGRPRVVCDRSQVKELRAGGASWTEIEKKTGLSRSTIRRICAPRA